MGPWSTPESALVPERPYWDELFEPSRYWRIDTSFSSKQYNIIKENVNMTKAGRVHSTQSLHIEPKAQYTIL